MRNELEITLYADNPGKLPKQPKRRLFYAKNRLTDADRDGEEEARELLQKILAFDPNPAPLSLADMETPSDETRTARQAAIQYGNVSIVSLAGQEVKLSEFFGTKPNPVWEFEPLPDFEKKVVKKQSFSGDRNCTNTLGRANEDTLWSLLEEVADEVFLESGLLLDLKNLTPHQAVLLIETLMRKRMTYETIVVPGKPTDIANRIRQENRRTSRPDLLDLAKDDEKRFRKEVKNLRKKIDHMTADQILEYKFGVCAHIAASSQKLYEVLKKRQTGLLLNGSYLVYHSEAIGTQIHKGRVENHAYNILVVTSPTKKQEPKISLSVLDPTWTLADPESTDYTHNRISQTISFLFEYGKQLGLANYQKTCQELAKLATGRLKRHMIHHHTLSQIHDYASLCAQTEDNEPSIILAKLKEIFMANYYDNMDFLLTLFNIPSVSFDAEDGNRGVFSHMEFAVMSEIEQVRFNDRGSGNESFNLMAKLDFVVGNTNIKWLDSLNKPLFVQKRQLKDSDRARFCSINQLLRASVELNIAPSQEARKVITAALKVNRRLGIEYVHEGMAQAALQIKSGRRTGE